MEHKGIAISRHGLEADGIAEGRTVYWNLAAGAALRARRPARRGDDRRRGAAGLPDRAAHRPLAERQVHGPGAVASKATSGGASSTGRSSPRSSTACSRRPGRTPASNDLFVFDGYAGADPTLPPEGAGDHRVRLAQPVRAQHVRARGRPDGARRTSSPSFTVVDVPSVARRPGDATAPAPRPSSCSTSPAAWS